MELWSEQRPGADHAVDAVCIAPWVSLEFDPQGWVYACCANQLYPLGRIGEDRLADLWAGPRAQVLRDALSRWDMSVGCGSCRWHLEHGRMDPDAAVYDRYHLDSEEPSGPVAMTFALSNRCNLACSMCNAELSSTIRRRSGLAPLQQRYDDEFFDDLAPLLGGLRYAKFLGGEPFLVPEHDRVWTLMDAVGAPERLQVTTNGTVWTDRVEWLLDRFLVDVTLSIDAVSAERYESIRSGASHAAVVRNLERFHAACRGRGTELRLCFCLMEGNWQELPGFLTWADDLDVPVSINVVSDLGHALHDLPLEDLADVASTWARSAAPTGRNSGVWATQVAQLESVLAERGAGIPPATRQAQPAPPRCFAVPARRPSEPASLEDERRRLVEWSGGGPFAEIVVDDQGSVLRLAAPHRRLGIDLRMVGAPLERLSDVIAAADGRPLWQQGDEDTGAVVVRTVVLAAERPERGVAGSIVRAVFVPTPGGWTALVAEDRIYERPGRDPLVR